ncbi:MAG: hypothetical protein COB66_00920 [Coxiella sp. (in: Bacteria)]|nr:MAG: hypothetical protein COB66_00920 [Coxiella sp. (in: g-proteobacteria)]
MPFHEQFARRFSVLFPLPLKLAGAFATSTSTKFPTPTPTPAPAENVDFGSDLLLIPMAAGGLLFVVMALAYITYSNRREVVLAQARAVGPNDEEVERPSAEEVERPSAEEVERPSNEEVEQPADKEVARSSDEGRTFLVRG